VVCAAAAVLALTACGGSGSGGGGGGGGSASSTTQPTACTASCTVTGASASVTVGNGGATVTYQPSSGAADVVLTVPAGAVAADTTLTLATGTVVPADPGVVPGLVFDLGPSGTTFALPLSLAIGYLEAGLGAVAEADLRVATVDSGGWLELPTTLDPAANRASASISHFSRYAGRAHDAIAPTATPSPAAASTIAASTALVVHFSERMDSTSLDLAGSSAEILGAAQSWSKSAVPNDTLTLAAAPWSAGAKTLALDASDAVGNPLAAPLSVAYTVDATPPGVVSSTPDTSFTRNDGVVIVFDESMTTTASASGTMVDAIYPPSGAWSTTNGNANDTLTLTPYSTLYPWLVGAGRTLNVAVKDKAGNAITVNLTYTVN